MFTVPVTTQDLELETAELLPSRETLNACYRSPHSSSGATTINNQTGYGNVAQNGGGGGLLGNVAVGGGNLDNINVLSFGSGNGQGFVG